FSRNRFRRELELSVKGTPVRPERPLSRPGCVTGRKEARPPTMPPDTSNLPVKSCGNYDLLEKVAEGGMGAIYKGRHRDTGQLAAIKIMPAHMASNTTLLRRFKQEFLAASKLDHPNIVRGLAFGTEGDKHYLVMEYVDGESLGAKLERDGKMT